MSERGFHQRLLLSLEPVLRDALPRWALPDTLEREVAFHLLEDWPTSSRENAWRKFLAAARRGALRFLVREDQTGQFTLNADFRQILLAVWQSDEAHQGECRALHRRLAEYYDARWHALAEGIPATSGTELRQPIAAQAEQVVLLQQGLYHHFAYDPGSAFERFEQLFQEYEWLNAAPICQNLFAVAEGYRESLLPRHRFWLDFYQAKLAGVMARAHRYDRAQVTQLRAAEEQGLTALLDNLAASPLPAPERAELEGWTHMQLGRISLLRIPLRPGLTSLDDPYLRAALYNFIQAAERFARLGALRDEIAARNNIGLVYQQAGLAEKAIAEYEAVKERLTGQETGQLHALAVLYLNLGSATEDLVHRTHDAKLEKATLRYYEQAAGTFDLVQFDYGRGLALLSLGRYLVLQGDFVKAEKKLEEALQILSEVNAPEAEIARALLRWLRGQLGPQQEQATHTLEMQPVHTDPWLALMISGGTKIQYIVSRYLLRMMQDEGDELILFKNLSTSAGPPLKAEPGDTDAIKQARATFRQGYFRKAAGWYGLAEVRAHAYGQVAEELEALSGQAVAWLNAGELQRSIESATRLLARARELGRQDYTMRAVLELGGAMAAVDLRSRWREIRPLLLEGLSIARHLGDTFYQVYHLLRLGDYAVQMGEDEQGYTWLQDALNALGSDVEEQSFFRAEIYRSLSDLMCRRGDFAEAKRFAEMALGAAGEDGNPAYIADAQLTLARVGWRLGHTDEALRLTDEVLAAAGRYGWTAHEQRAQQLRAGLLLDVGQPQAARQAARRALEVAREMPAREAEVRALLSLGQALATLGEQDNARHTLFLARRLSQERDYEDHFHRAEVLLQPLADSGVKA